MELAQNLGTTTNGYEFGQGSSVSAIIGSGSAHGGGGGGGYYGGFLGESGTNNGGGGGSGYVNMSILNNASGTNGTQSGNGQAKITLVN